MRRLIPVFLLILALAVSAPAFAADAQPVAVTGLKLTCTLPENAQPDGGAVLENGDYTQPYLIDDGMAVVTLARRAEETGAQAFVDELYPEAKEVKAIEQQPVGSYPAERLTFTTGENEDTRQCVLVAFSTDSGSFAFVAETPADAFEDYRQTIETWTASLDLVDG